MSIRKFFGRVAQYSYQAFCPVVLAFVATVWFTPAAMGQGEQREENIALAEKESRQPNFSRKELGVQEVLEHARRMTRQTQYLIAGQKDQQQHFAEMIRQQQEQIHELHEQLQHLHEGLIATHEELEGGRMTHLPPIQDGQMVVFPLKYINAEEIAGVLHEFYGTDQLRLAPDPDHNRLLVFAKQRPLADIKQLVKQLDVADESTESARGEVEHARPLALMVRLFWLADGPLEGESTWADDGIPFPLTVLDAVHRLGLSEPYLVTQSTASLALGEEEEGCEFHFNFPAIIHGVSLQFQSHGEMVFDGQPRLDLQVEVSGQFELGGRLSAPLGHYMVLGTANYVPSRWSGGGGLGGGYGGGSDGGEEPKLITSHFAFVVQVIEAKSFAPEE